MSWERSARVIKVLPFHASRPLLTANPLDSWMNLEHCNEYEGAEHYGLVTRRWWREEGEKEGKDRERRPTLHTSPHHSSCNYHSSYIYQQLTALQLQRRSVCQQDRARHLSYNLRLQSDPHLFCISVADCPLATPDSSGVILLFAWPALSGNDGQYGVTWPFLTD